MHIIIIPDLNTPFKGLQNAFFFFSYGQSKIAIKSPTIIIPGAVNPVLPIWLSEGGVGLVESNGLAGGVVPNGLGLFRMGGGMVSESRSTRFPKLVPRN